MWLEAKDTDSRVLPRFALRIYIPVQSFLPQINSRLRPARILAVRYSPGPRFGGPVLISEISCLLRIALLYWLLRTLHFGMMRELSITKHAYKMRKPNIKRFVQKCGV